jgi:hypothetical protein
MSRRLQCGFDRGNLYRPTLVCAPFAEAAVAAAAWRAESASDETTTTVGVAGTGGPCGRSFWGTAVAGAAGGGGGSTAAAAFRGKLACARHRHVSATSYGTAASMPRTSLAIFV